MSAIEWTEKTWNPVSGCRKISAGCVHCYAETMAVRLKGMRVSGYEKGFEPTLQPGRLAQPTLRKTPTRWFVNSMSDLFLEEISFDYIDTVFDIIRSTPQHTYQILTKRPLRMREYVSGRLPVPGNVWLGVTAENRRQGYPRIDILRDIPSPVRFLSCEPLLEGVDDIDLSGIHWVIAGGESGRGARTMRPEWAEELLRACQAQSVPFFFKQWGRVGPDGRRRSKRDNGRLLMGRLWEEYPRTDTVGRD